MADVIIISKASANRAGAKLVAAHAREINPKAQVIESDLLLTEEGDTDLRGRRVVVIEDGSTVTHGGMAYGAGYEYAVTHGAIVLEPGRFAVGMIKDAFMQYPHLRKVLPAVGYSEKEIMDLQETINRSNAELVVSGTPTDIRRVLKANIPIVHIAYEMKESGAIRKIVDGFLRKNGL